MKASFQRPAHQKSTAACAAMPFLFAEEEGFEPPVPCGTTVFKTAAIDHSAIPPDWDCKDSYFSGKCASFSLIEEEGDAGGYGEDGTGVVARVEITRSEDVVVGRGYVQAKAPDGNGQNKADIGSGGKVAFH